MNKIFVFNTKDIVAVEIFLEKRKTRIYVGRLTQEIKNKKTNYHLEYDLPYLTNRAAIPLGPEFPLTNQFYDAPILFPSFQDRIPPRENPAYIDYCKMEGVSIEEENPIVLLSTIGSRGPSSFIFEPLFKERFTSEDLKNYREELGLSIREFSGLFSISPGHLQRIEAHKFPGKEILERIERYQKYPEDVFELIAQRGGVLHTDQKIKLIKHIHQYIKNTISKTYQELFEKQKGKLTDWQKIKIKEAIDYYKTAFYKAANVSLNLALAHPSNISKTLWHSNKLKEEAQKINLEKDIAALFFSIDTE
jgi:transcriptional regulator with XRE-family HTH domain